MKFDISFFCDQGTPLKENHDRILVNGSVVSDGIGHLYGVNEVACFVADGIGSLKNSARAAQFILEAIARLGLQPDAEQLLEALNIKNEELVNLNRHDKEFYPSGTTLCGLVMDENGLYTLNVGDSEILVLSRGILNSLTDPQVLDTAMPNSPITSYLGTSHECMDAVIGDRYTKYRKGDLLIICTDGLRKVFSNRELTILLESETSLASKAEAMYVFIKKDMVPDNVGVILIQNEEEL